MNWVRSSVASFRQVLAKGLPTIGTALAGVAAGVVLVISCNLGPSISMAGGTSGGAGSGGTGAGSTGGDTTGGGGGGSTGGGSGGSCDCTFSGPVTLAGPVTIAGPVNNIPASEDSAQLVSGQLQHTGSGVAEGAFDCSSIATRGVPTQASNGASCVKLVDGPFVLTDLNIAQGQNIGAAYLFAAPPSASWTSDTQPAWSVTQILTLGTPVMTYAGMRYALPSGSSLYAISDFAGFTPGTFAPAAAFNWAGFRPYH